VGQRNESEEQRSPIGDHPEASSPPPPPAVPNPPLAPTAIAIPAKRPGPRIDVRNAIIALTFGAAGWLIWIFAWFAESDSGYPDGLACTAHPPRSEAYTSCMLSSERSGAIAGALALGLAVAGTVMVRPRPGHDLNPGALFATLAAGAFSVLLAIAGGSVWLRGASGDLYEGRLGSTGWHLAMVISVGVGLAAGWAVTRRRVDDP
jgi:hypothetical protein